MGTKYPKVATVTVTAGREARLKRDNQKSTVCMEGSPRTLESDRIQFAVIVIETAAKKMGISTSELSARLQRQGLIEGRLIRFYDTLHTQSADYAADDIIETLHNYESRH